MTRPMTHTTASTTLARTSRVATLEGIPMITVDRGNGIEMADESLFEKRTGVETYDDADVSWVEYWEGTHLVHRSANVALKGREIKLEMGRLG